MVIETYPAPKLLTQMKLRSSSYNYSEPRNYQKKYTAKLQNSKHNLILCPHLLPSPVLAQVKIRSSTGSRAQELPRIISIAKLSSSRAWNSSAPACFPKFPCGGHPMWPHLVQTCAVPAEIIRQADTEYKDRITAQA